jgi:hypothetical protein
MYKKCTIEAQRHSTRQRNTLGERQYLSAVATRRRPADSVIFYLSRNLKSYTANITKNQKKFVPNILNTIFIIQNSHKEHKETAWCPH